MFEVANVASWVIDGYKLFCECRLRLLMEKSVRKRVDPVQTLC